MRLMAKSNNELEPMFHPGSRRQDIKERESCKWALRKGCVVRRIAKIATIVYKTEEAGQYIFRSEMVSAIP